jgi:hypothetical protein
LAAPPEHPAPLAPLFLKSAENVVRINSHDFIVQRETEKDDLVVYRTVAETGAGGQRCVQHLILADCRDPTLKFSLLQFASSA